MEILFNYMRKKDPDGPGRLLCPYIEDHTFYKLHHRNGKLLPQRFKLIQRLGAYIVRYKCMYCGNTFRVDRTPIFRYNIPLKEYVIKDYKPNY